MSSPPRFLQLLALIDAASALRAQPSRRMALASAGAFSSTLLSKPDQALAISTQSLYDKLATSAALAQGGQLPISLALRPTLVDVPHGPPPLLFSTELPLLKSFL